MKRFVATAPMSLILTVGFKLREGQGNNQMKSNFSTTVIRHPCWRGCACMMESSIETTHCRSRARVIAENSALALMTLNL